MCPTAIVVPAQSRPPCASAQALRNAGVRVAEAYSGADVKRFISIQQPDAVLMEAGITPSASADVWRALDQCKPAHVVVFGDFRDPAVRNHAREHGAVCLAPQSDEDLVAAVQSLVGRYRAARQQSERLRSELSANMRHLQTHMRQFQLQGQARPPADGLLILVADDEECVRRFFSATLERSGYTALETCDGNEAVRALWNYGDAVRLVILDWAMPGLSGVDVVRSMRKVSPESRILICTGSPEEVVRTALGLESVEGVLEKPFLALDLLEEVDRQLRQAPRPAVSRSGS